MALHPTCRFTLVPRRSGLGLGLGLAGGILALLAMACEPSSDAAHDDPDAAGAGAGAASAPDAGSASAPAPSSTEAGAPPPSARDLELARMQAHIDSLYAQSDVVHRFKTAFGDDVDCVPFQKQPGFAQVASLNGAAPVLAAQAHVVRPAAVAGFGDGADAAGNARSCPSGAVPIRHLTINDLARFATLEDFLARTPSHAVAPNGSAIIGPEGAVHEHALYQSTVANWGGQTTLNLWNPAVAPHTFSLSQLWVVRGENSDLQTVEAGYTADLFRNGDADSRLFIYSTTDNYQNTKETDCYDLDCKAFIQLGDTHVLLGGKFDKASVLDGEQREFTLRWQFCPASECEAWEGWWLYYEGGVTSEWVGFYPRNRYSASGLHDEASRLDFGGEVAFFAGGAHPTTDMGSGQIPSAGFGRAAYQTNLLRITTGHAWASFDSLLTQNAEASSCYDSGGLTTPFRLPTRQFSFGGSGYSGACQ